MAINTTGIKITPNCELPNQLSVTKSAAPLSLPEETRTTVSATSVKGCSFNASVDIGNPEAPMSGVTNVPDCSTNTTGLVFQPVRQFLSS
jgi:hypothetical protein